ncbi:ribokinase [Candidatus Scalindua japonica]|uniref:Ribokinase n=1 Tax=Candidatus Scalindua japonica TaxID=1284222 RepID=A0A286TUB6_9BACT|nr:PfkB family carbohydrate kinase [Candidatus Scalindua japonica]GAX59500.1 ribokinase [Candidatus Scalindua japonica]
MNYDVVGLGQCCIDYLGVVEQYPGINEKEEVNDLTVQGGGPVATAMVTLSRLGASTTFIGKISDDYFGSLIKDSLTSEFVNIDHIIVEKDKRSQFAFIVIEKETGKRTVLWSRATVTPLRLEEINRGVINTAKVLLLDGLMKESSMAAAEYAREAGVTIVVDAGSMREGTLALVNLSDYFIASEDFARQFSHDNDPKVAAMELIGLGAKIVIVTLGEKGSISVTSEECFYQPAFNVRAVDTTGCGDVFHGAFIFGLLQKWDLNETIRFASATAALKCSEIGGRTAIPDLREVEVFLENDNDNWPTSLENVS